MANITRKDILNYSIDEKDLADSIISTRTIQDGAVTTAKLASNAVKVTVIIPSLENRTGLAADSTGVKAEGARFKIYKTGLKSATLRATWTASHSDSTTAIELYDVTAGAVRASVSGNTGSDSETSVDVGSLVDGNLHELRVNVTTASATSGATTDVSYAVLELTYGFS